ncbi:MAG: DNA primase [Sulfuriferula sp.]
MIPQDFIQTLLSRVDIVEVIDRRVPLKKAGANYQACCPFHNEKSPSFTVSPTKQFYHCFGCGAHGTAIGFLMEYAGLGYVDAIKELAGQLGLSVPEATAANPEQLKQAASLVEIMQRAAQFYRQRLKQTPLAIDYLKKRGLTGEIAARFGLGYAPTGWQNLEAIFDIYTDPTLTEAGLVITNDAGQRYDRFRDRIMFPIVGQRGDVIGFGGRILEAGEPKYLNSPETPLFQKGNELYGLFQARRAIHDTGRAVVVEGYMDVVALAQHGVDYAVATLGTATTPIHVQKLLRHTDEIVFCFDGDAAGRRAAWRAMENSLDILNDGSRIGFLFLAPEHDPDSYIRAFGKAAFETLLTDEVVPLSVYLFKELATLHDLGGSEGRSAFLQAARPLLSQIRASALSLMLRKRCAELANLQLSELNSLWEIKSRQPNSSRAPARAARQAPASIWHRLLCIILFMPSLARELDANLIAPTGPDADALRAIVELLRTHPNLGTASIVDHFRDSALISIMQHASAEIMSWTDDLDISAEFEGACNQARMQIDKLQGTRVPDKPFNAQTEAEKEAWRQLVHRTGQVKK